MSRLISKTIYGYCLTFSQKLYMIIALNFHTRRRAYHALMAQLFIGILGPQCSSTLYLFGFITILIWASLMSLMKTQRASGVLIYNPDTFDNFLDLSAQKFSDQSDNRFLGYWPIIENFKKKFFSFYMLIYRMYYGIVYPYHTSTRKGKQEMRNTYEPHQQTTTTEHQIPDLGQVQTKAVGWNVLMVLNSYLKQ